MKFPDMDKPYYYEIRVEGHLAERWSDWFSGLAISSDSNGETSLSGVLVDQAALYGVLVKIHDLHLILVLVRRAPANEHEHMDGQSWGLDSADAATPIRLEP